MAQLCESDNDPNYICVNTGETIISNKPIKTDYVYTCTVLAFSINNKHFMSHIDDINPNMYNDIKHVLKNVYLPNVRYVHIWRGKLCKDNCKSLNISKEILNLFSKNTKFIFHLASSSIKYPV